MNAKENIKQLFYLFSDYCKWMYFDKGAKEKFDNKFVNWNGIKTSIKIKEDGNYLITLIDRNIPLDVKAWYVTSPGVGMENVQFGYKVLNEEDIPLDIKDLVMQNIFGMVSSTFTRTIAFCLFARLQPESIENIANDLAIILSSGEKE